MRILYLCPDLGIPVLGHKGASIHVREMVAALGRAGHDVVLAAALLEKSPWDRRVAVDAPVFHIPPSVETLAAVAGVRDLRDGAGARTSLPAELRRILYDRDLERDLLERLRHRPPDVIYERASVYATAGGRVARALGVPHVVELNAPLAREHGTYRSAASGDLAEACEREVLTGADAVVVVSGALRAHVIELGVDGARVSVEPNGVDPARFRPEPRDETLRARLGLNGGPVIGFVGGLRPWHGVEALPDVLERVAARHPGVRLVVAGDGPLAPVLERDLADRGLSDRVVLTRAVPHDDVPGLIRQLDVALAPYPVLDHDFYFSPLKVVEYMACGVPVVAPAVGEIPRLVRDHVTGVLYPVGDLDALTDACTAMLDDPALARRLGSAGEALVRERYTWDHIAARIASEAQALVSERRELAR